MVAATLTATTGYGRADRGPSVISTIGTMPNPFDLRLGVTHRTRPHRRQSGFVSGASPRRPGAGGLRARRQRPGRRTLSADGSIRGAPGRHATITASLTGGGSIRGAPGTASRAQPPAKPQGKNDRTFSYRERGSLATVGHLNGVARVFGLSLTGLPAWLLWRAYYLSQMPTFGRKPRIFSNGMGRCSSTRTSPISVLRAARTP